MQAGKLIGSSSLMTSDSTYQSAYLVDIKTKQKKQMADDEHII